MRAVTPKTCKINKGSTLQEVANFLKLESWQLMLFHNLHCPNEKDKINGEIPFHVDTIYFPPLDDKIRIEIFQKYKKEIENVSQLNMPYSFEKRYGIIQKKYNSDNLISEISYEIDVQLSSKNNYKINKDKTYINQKEIDLTVEELGNEIASIFYPLEVKTYASGLLQNIENYKEISERWVSKKKVLKEYYKGKIADDIFQKIDKQILRKGTTQRKIMNSLFYNLYFFPLYEKYTENECFTTLRIPLAGEGRIPFEVISVLQNSINPTQKIHLSIKGKTLEEDEDLYPYKGILNFDYKLNAKDHSIHSIKGSVKWANIHENKEQLIQFELYQL